MTFRSRILLATLPLALVPLALFAWGTRSLLERRLTAQYHASVETATHAIEARVENTSSRVAARVQAFALSLRDDIGFRLGAVQQAPEQRDYVHDLAGSAMAQADLDALEIVDASGRILSSGHFSNAFDQPSAALESSAQAAQLRPVLAIVQTPTSEFVALVRATEIQVGGQFFRVIGGVRISEQFLRDLSTDPDVLVTLELPQAEAEAEAEGTGLGVEPLTREIDLAFASGDTARLIVAASDAPLREWRAQVDRWMFGALGVATLLAVILASFVSARMSKPIAELQRKTSRIDLDSLDADFESDRSDEIGSLSNMLGAMQRRLRTSASRLRDAERRAVIGEVARQVNHDVRNGLTPIRNVVEHLSDVAHKEPETLSTVFLERQPTLDASVEYLHALAANYARISPRLERQPCDLNDIARGVAEGAPGDGRVRVRTDLAPGMVMVVADPVALRRIVENLTTNAVESVEEGNGDVVIATKVASAGRVRMIVADNGRGMNEEEKAKVFDHFYTTKSSGTGLGLSIVRRLTGDLGGSIRLESEPGRGTRFIVELPAAREREVS